MKSLMSFLMTQNISNFKNRTTGLTILTPNKLLTRLPVLLVNNQHQEKPEVLYTYTPNKFYAYLLNVETSNLMKFFENL